LKEISTTYRVKNLAMIVLSLLFLNAKSLWNDVLLENKKNLVYLKKHLFVTTPFFPKINF
jgi:hypothetical protein